MSHDLSSVCLQRLLSDERLCQSEALYAFLSPSPEHLKVNKPCTLVHGTHGRTQKAHPVTRTRRPPHAKILHIWLMEEQTCFQRMSCVVTSAAFSVFEGDVGPEEVVFLSGLLPGKAPRRLLLPHGGKRSLTTSKAAAERGPVSTPKLTCVSVCCP